MAAAAEELRRLLGEFNRRHGADLSMVVSRTGVPLAHEGPRDLNADNFASLAATLMNAADVIYSGLSRPSPSRVVVESNKATLIACTLGSLALFVAVGPRRDEMLRGTEDITAGIRSVLAAK